MATRTLQVVISGDAKGVNRAFGQVDSAAKRTEGRLHKFGVMGAKSFAVLGAAAGGVAAVGLTKSAKAAIEAEKSQAKLQAQLRAAGISWKAHAKEIDSVIQKHSALSGLDDEDLQDSFTNILRVTGDVSKSLRLNGIAADFARAKHIEVAKAGEIVGKVAGGNTGILGRYGIVIDKNATSSEALAALQKKFAGQAEAYGKTTAGSLDRAGVASENLGEVVGAKMTPILAKAADGLVRFVDTTGKLGGPIRTVTGTIRRGYDTVVRAVERFANRNREELQTAAQAFRNVARAVRWAFDTIIVPILRTAGRAILRVLDGIKDTLSGLVRFVTNILTGKWGKAWDAAKDTVRGAARTIVAVLRGLIETAAKVVEKVGGAILKGIVAGLKGLGSAVGRAVLKGLKAGIGWAAGKAADWIDKANPLSSVTGNLGGGTGDGIGKGLIGAGGVLPSGGAFGGSLMGARPAMRPFAAIGSRFGLNVSSGRDGRVGKLTSSGNTSWHSSGEAIDMSGPAGGMMAYAKSLRSKFGGRLAELIYTPMGAGIKNGRPYTYGGQVAADHFDHVHVAFDSGRPGIGDGLGYNQLKSLWTRAGGPASQANTAAAVALAESGGNPSIVNSIGATGLWQIHPAEPGSKDPLTNAKQAVRKFRESGWQPWEAYTGPDGRGSDGPWRRFLRSGSSSGGGGGTGGHAGRGRGHLVSTARPGGIVGGGPTTGQAAAQTVADVDLAKATATAHDDLGGLIRALQSERAIKKRRARHIRRYLRRKRIKPANRRKFTEELTQLVGEIAELDALLKEYKADAKGGATTISGAEALTAGVADSGGDSGDADPTPLDFLDRDATAASLTADPADDLAVATRRRDYWQQKYNEALATPDPRDDVEAGNALREATAAVNDLTESITHEGETAQRLLDATLSLAAEVKTQNEFSRSVAGIATREAVRALADVISGQIVGTNLQGRRLTAGNGVVAITP